jgi:hypothetical protein
MQYATSCAERGALVLIILPSIYLATLSVDVPLQKMMGEIFYMG